MKKIWCLVSLILFLPWETQLNNQVSRFQSISTIFNPNSQGLREFMIKLEPSLYHRLKRNPKRPSLCPVPINNGCLRQSPLRFAWSPRPILQRAERPPSANLGESMLRWTIFTQQAIVRPKMAAGKKASHVFDILGEGLLSEAFPVGRLFCLPPCIYAWMGARGVF